MKPTELGFALLLSIPVGAGVSTAMLRVVGGNVTDPLVAGPGIATALGLLAFLLLALETGQDERAA
jgi:hypothetical protein